jgi:hypothetical protein
VPIRNIVKMLVWGQALIFSNSLGRGLTPA